MSSTFLFLYIAFTSTLLFLSAGTSTASTPSSPTDDGDDDSGGDDSASTNQLTVHLMEVWTKDAADAYTIAPMILRTGTYNNVLRVRWYWNKHCNGKHIILYVYTDDNQYFHENATKRPELDYPDQSQHQLDQHSQNLVDIDLRPFNQQHHKKGDDHDGDANKKIRTDSRHISDQYVVRNDDGSINQKKSILTIAHANNIKCDILKALCDKTHHWAPCMGYKVFCKGKHKLANSFDNQSCRNIATACDLSTNTVGSTYSDEAQNDEAIIAPTILYDDSIPHVTDPTKPYREDASNKVAKRVFSLPVTGHGRRKAKLHGRGKFLDAIRLYGHFLKSIPKSLGRARTHRNLSGGRRKPKTSSSSSSSLK
eukprot:gene16634-18323_t